MNARRVCWLLIAATATVTACGAGDRDASREATTTAAAPAQAADCGAGARALPGGRLYLPSGARARRTPLLVVVVPGPGGDSSDRLGLRRAGLPKGLAVLYPTQDGGFWALNHAQGDADLDAVTTLLTRVLDLGCFDRRRVSVTGVSNGAGFATRLACSLPSRFAGLAPVAAGYRALDPCSPQAHASLLAIHGSADTVVPYNGKRPGREGSVPSFAARWARRLGCTGTPQAKALRTRVTRIAYGGCDAGRSVTLLRLTGTTHGWPGATIPGLPQRNPSRFRATPQVVAFALRVRGA